ncbi:hypothetical protein OY671_008439, partial [Metschnikowia pulcherrima]
AFGVSVIEREGAYVLNGEKRHVMPGAGVDGWSVTADGERGTALFFVAAGTPGVTAQVHARADGGAACHSAIESAVVPADASSARDGVSDAVDEASDSGRSMQSAESAGVARQASADSVAYSNTRQQFGRPSASFQASQHRSAEMSVARESASSMAYVAVAASTEPDAAQRRRMSASAKLETARAGRSVAQMAVQLHGGMGMTDESEVGDYFKRSTVADSSSGDSAEQSAVSEESA